MDEPNAPAAAGDDGFWDLFQDEDPGPPIAHARQESAPATPELVVMAQADDVELRDLDEFNEFDADEVNEVAPVMAVAPGTATGRLFRSYYVIDPTATPALRPDQARKLRTVRTPVDNDGREGGVAPTGGARVADDQAMSKKSSGGRRRGDRGQSDRGRSRGLRGGLGYVVVIAVTLLVGLIDALVTKSAFGLLTGVALLASTIYVALTLRRSDVAVAAIAPPIAALITALTVGQLGVQGGIVERGLAVFLVLGRNWAWILAAVLVGVVIAVIRSRRGAGSAQRGPNRSRGHRGHRGP